MELHKNAHIAYFKNALSCLPPHYVGLDTSRLSAIYFAVVGLDILNALDSIDKQHIVEYIYLMQLHSANDHFQSAVHFGFIGSPYMAHNMCQPCAASSHTIVEKSSSKNYLFGHIAMTYTALCSLLTLGDDLSRVEKNLIVKGLSQLQEPDGSYRATPEECESDMRFLYCACAISAMLDDWGGVDRDRAVGFVLRCITYEGGISLFPGVEAQGGATFCGLASLALMGRLDDLTAVQKSDILGWCERRQDGGYQGRTNKEPDSCYSFWVGASIGLLGAFQFTDTQSNREFLLESCQCRSEFSGGFSKLPDSHPDILHSFYSLGWLALAQADGLNPLDIKIVICKDKIVRS